MGKRWGAISVTGIGEELRRHTLRLLQGCRGSDVMPPCLAPRASRFLSPALSRFSKFISLRICIFSLLTVSMR